MSGHAGHPLRPVHLWHALATLGSLNIQFTQAHYLMLGHLKAYAVKVERGRDQETEDQEKQSYTRAKAEAWHWRPWLLTL